jgi:hypothetical protein
MSLRIGEEAVRSHDLKSDLVTETARTRANMLSRGTTIGAGSLNFSPKDGTIPLFGRGGAWESVLYGRQAAELPTKKS